MSNEYNGKKRSELPDSVFGIPQERKYPMPDEKHTRSAIKLFNHVDPKYEEQLAKAVIKNMKKYRIDGSVVGPNNRLRKYLPKDMIKESANRPLIYTWERANIPEYSVIRESSHKSDFSYSGINTSTEKSEFKRNFREVFKEDPTESSVNYMQMIKYKGDLVGYIGFSRYKEGKKKYLGIGNFMILKRYQRSGMGSKVISDIIDRYKDNYDEIYCYVDKDNTNAIAFYKKIAKVNTDNLTKYGYYVTLYSKSIGESAMLEGYLKSDKDIYYNKDKFDAGEINLCFITGLSGSGKSTMGRGMSSKNIEHYEMDDIICNDNFSDDNLKEYGGLISSFFKGAGKSFRLIQDDDKHNDSVFNTHKNYEKEITQAFVKHAISYCKSHKETKYVCDGIWIFMFIKPEQLKDCAVYIKGTSSIKSGYRALKRDIDEDKRNGMTSLQIFKHEFKRVKEDILYARENQKELRSFRSYFEKQSTNESMICLRNNRIYDRGSLFQRLDENPESILNEKGNYDHPHSKSCINEASGTNKEIKKKDLDDMKTIIKSLKDDDYKDFEIRKNAYYFKIEYKDDKPVGFVRMIAMRDNQYEHCRVLDISLAVDPDYRKQGIARKLASEAIRKAKQDKSIYRIYWGALRSNTGSISLAKSLGFKEEPKYGDKEYIVFYLQIGKGIDVDKMNESAPMQLENKDITIIFDLGDVLVKSNMIEDLKNKYKFSNSDIKTILSHWFDDSYDLYDSNTFIETMERVLPDKFKSRIFDIILAFKNISLYPYTEKILSDIKRLGYKIYYFSNWSRWGVELLEDANKLRFLHEYFDGGMFSYETKYKKPHKRFYDIFIQKFKLQKSNIIFFDNKQDNINMGKNFGWTGYVVDENLDQHFHDMISSYTNEYSNLPQNTGITTVIFDIGDVLVSANIKDYLMADPEVPNEIVDELLKLWFIDKDEVDDTMDLDTYREIVNKRMGVEFSKYIPKLFQYNVDCVTAFDYTIPIIQDLKDKGYKVYYLSNWSAWTHDLLQEAGKFDFLKLMDGGVFSYDAGYMKPNEEIYKILLNKYKINPEEAVFFDDREENIEAANKLGIHGIHFPRHDASIVYNNLYGRKLVKTIYEDMDNIRYDFDQSYNDKVLEDAHLSYMKEISLGVKVDEDKVAKEIESSIKSIVMTSANKSSASKLGLTLKCKLEDVDSRIACILILDGSQDKRDTDGARTILKDIANKCKSKLGDLVSKVDIGDGDEGCLYFTMNRKYIIKNRKDFVQEYGTTGGTIVGANQPDSVYIVNYMQNNVFSGYKEPKQAICKKGMNQMYTTKNGKAIPVDIDKFKEEASDISVFRFKETPILSFDKIIENASVDGDFYMLLTGDYPTNQHEIEYDNRFIQEDNFFDKLDDITYCTESTIIGQIEATDYPYMKILTESMEGRCWNYYRDINGVFAMNELTGLRTPSYENITDIPNSQIQLIERGTVYFGD